MSNIIRSLTYLCLIFTSQASYSQNCERFNRKLFHMLPAYVPDEINCVDSQGRKQEWWINYKVDYNPTRIPDELDTGFYVDHYSFGKYQNNRKVGNWIGIENGHMIYVSWRDSFWYDGEKAGVFRYDARGKLRSVE